VTQNNFNSKIESYLKEIPSLPVSVGKVLEICNNSSSSPTDLNQVISLDPVLTGKLLQLINSAYYGLGLGSHVTSIVKAITMLGTNTVKNLALSSAILSTLPKNKEQSGLDMEGFWRHCLCVGVFSKLIAIRQKVDSRYHQEYFTAGLLHDIGKIPLNAVLSSEYMNTITSADRDNSALHIIENEKIGTNHTVIGKLIAAAWKLDNPVADVIACHHNTEEYNGDFVHILYTVAVSNYFSVLNDIGFAGNRKPVKPEKKIWDFLKIKEDIYEEFIGNVNEEINKAKIFLQI
jgi:putative nucleotidyltransferase with HDIG domain